MSKILIISDDTGTYVPIKEMLNISDIANNFEAALLMMDSNRYDILILDNDLLKISEFDFITNAIKLNNSAQIIMLCDLSDIRSCMLLTKNKAIDYLPKPVDISTLLSAVKNSEETVLERTRELEMAMIGVLKLVFTIVKLKDPLTDSHQTRVGNLAAAIGEQMGLDTKTIELLRIIGYMHDIGKVAIPIEILSKPGQLSYLEMEMIRNHSYYGYDMIRNAHMPSVISETVLQHHERCDGSGYPKGLKAEEIGFESKILMVADVVESMASHRPYRPALGIQLALEEITENAGVLYDADIVNACEALFLSNAYKIDETQHDIVLSFNNK